MNAITMRLQIVVTMRWEVFMSLLTKRPWDPVRSLIAHGLSVEDRAALLAGAERLGARVQFCSAVAEAASGVLSNAPAAVVLGLGVAARSNLIAIEAALCQKPVPVLLRHTLTAGAVKEVVRWRLHNHDIRCSIEGFDPLERGVVNLLSAADTSVARLEIMARAGSDLDDPALRVVAAAAVIGERMASVNELAALCGCSCRTLEAWLVDGGVLPPKRLLMWMLALHVSFRIVRLGWTPKCVAAEAGFHSVRALSNRVHRATGLRISNLCHTFGFAEALEQFVAEMPR